MSVFVAKASQELILFHWYNDQDSNTKINEGDEASCHDTCGKKNPCEEKRVRQVCWVPDTRKRTSRDEFYFNTVSEFRNARNNPESEYFQSPQLEESASKSKQNSRYPYNYWKINPKFHKKHPITENEVSDEKPYDKDDRVNGKTKFFY